jgi:formylglycine-generating enzyme required for sulfatase activity
VETVQEEAVLDERVLADLKEYQTQLGLRDQDVQALTDRILNPHRADAPFAPNQQPPAENRVKPDATALPPVTAATPLRLTFEIATIDASLKITRHPGSAEWVRETLSGGVNLDLVQIPGGRFVMGAAKDELGARGVESPPHEVTVPAFTLGQYPVTQAQWAAVATLPKIQQDLNPYLARFKGANRPVVQVSWWEAVEFCHRLSAQTGRSYRLPSEAEWEYACRSGTSTPFHFGTTITPDLANYRWSDTYGASRAIRLKDFEGTTPVGQFGVANAFGLYDMHGNVWEWCADHWHGNYEDAPTDGSAWLSAAPDADGVLRGGAWDYSPQRCRSAYRDSIARAYRSDFLGFRVSCL